MDYLLSIVIPTKNRYQTLFSVIDTLLGFSLEEMEIVVQDNSDENTSALAFFESRKNTNLKYFYQSEKLSIIENSDLAVKNSSGKYVCFIGDDDGVMPYIVNIVKWMEYNNYSVLKGNKPVYFWPGLEDGYLSTDSSGVLQTKTYTKRKKLISSKKAIKYTLSRGGTTMKELPCLYHGIIKKEILDKIFNKCDTYFPGPSPDMANAVAISLMTNEYVYVDIPIVITGRNVNSGAGMGVRRIHALEVKDVPWLPKNTEKEWDNKIPKYWIGSTIWAESCIKSVSKCGYIDLNQFRYSYLYAYLHVYQYRYRKYLFKNFKISYFNVNFIVDVFLCCWRRIIHFFIIKRVNKVRNRITRTNNLETIGSAIAFLSNNNELMEIINEEYSLF